MHGRGVRGVRIHGGNLRGARVHGGNLRGVRIHGGNLRGVRICGGNLRGARVHGGNERGARIHGGNERGPRHHTPVARNALLQPGILGPQLPPDTADWVWNRIYPRGPFTPRHVPFTGRERIIPALPRNPAPLDFFKLYITDEIVDHLVTQTNHYATQFIEREHANLRPRSTVHD